MFRYFFKYLRYFIKIYHLSSIAFYLSVSYAFYNNVVTSHSLSNLSNDLSEHGITINTIKKLNFFYPIIVKKKFNNWRDSVIKWFNNWVYNGWNNNSKHLYLYGESNTGKTVFIESLIGI